MKGLTDLIFDVLLLVKPAALMLGRLHGINLWSLVV
jgi:hypothetical protein